MPPLIKGDGGIILLPQLTILAAASIDTVQSRLLVLKL